MALLSTTEDLKLDSGIYVKVLGSYYYKLFIPVPDVLGTIRFFRSWEDTFYKYSFIKSRPGSLVHSKVRKVLNP